MANHQMFEHRIIRRRTRSFLTQMVVAAAIASCAVFLAAVGGGASQAALATAFGAAALSIAGLLQGHQMRTAPRALIATPDYLALLSRNGDRRYVRWAEVSAARHKTSFKGMSWTLVSDTGKVFIADPGIDADRWGILWHVVTSCVLSHGGGVRVDAISNGLYDSASA